MIRPACLHMDQWRLLTSYHKVIASALPPAIYQPTISRREYNEGLAASLPFSLPTPRPLHPFAVSPVHQLLECFGGGPYTSMLHRCFSMTIIFLTIASPPFCFFFPCQCRAVFGLSELFPRALIGYWMLSFFLIKYFDHGYMYRAYVCVL